MSNIFIVYYRGENFSQIYPFATPEAAQQLVDEMNKSYANANFGNCMATMHEMTVYQSFEQFKLDV